MKRICNIFALVFLLVLLAANVSAVGIGGPNLKKTLDFEPGKEVELKYVLIPSDEPMDYDIAAEPLPDSEVDITDYILFDSNILNDVPPKKKKVFAAKVKMPETSPVSGLHGAKICVEEEPKISAGRMAIKISACAQLFILVDAVKKERKSEKIPAKIIEKAEAPVVKTVLEKEESNSENTKHLGSKKSGPQEEQAAMQEEAPVSKRAVVRISALLAALLCAGIIARGMYYRLR